MGTVGYMSPEQVRGKPADSRSDIFAFGAILYEMLSGKRAFHGDSAVETMSAILKEDPPDLAETNRNVSPALERIVRHCLEKNPAERFQSARDVAFNLEALTDISTSTRGGVRAIPGREVYPPLAPSRWSPDYLLLASWAGIYLFARRGTVAAESHLPRSHLPQRHHLGRPLRPRRPDHRLRRRLGRRAAGNFLHPL